MPVELCVSGIPLNGKFNMMPARKYCLTCDAFRNMNTVLGGKWECSHCKVKLYEAELVERMESRIECGLARERSYSALVGKIQDIVEQALPTLRHSDYDVLDQGVRYLARGHELALTIEGVDKTKLGYY